MPTTSPAEAPDGSNRRQVTYGNFADPLGLVWRMLSQGGVLGRSALTREALAKLATPFDMALAKRERRLVASASPPEKPILLVTGLPRSGTTLVYQALARQIDVSYFTNRNAMFPRSPVTAAKLFERRFEPPAGPLRSLYGNTRGMTGPNDGFHFWDRFFGADRYQAERLDDGNCDELRRALGAWETATDKPLLNKNNRHADCLIDLIHALPTATIIIVDRDPRFVAQSLLKARRWVQGDEKIGWGLGADANVQDESEFAAIDSVCRQVESSIKRLNTQLAKVDPSRVVRFDYAEFCQEPRREIAAVDDRVAGVDMRSRSDLPAKFEAADRWSVSGSVRERIEQQLAELDAEKR